MEKKLKPCPFCGGKGEIREESSYVGSYVVKCSDCGSGTWIMSKNDAIKCWNKRVKQGEPGN